MKQLVVVLALFPIAIAVAACAHEVVTSPVEARVAPVPTAPPTPEPPHDVVAAHEGTPLMAEQLTTLIHERLLTDKTVSYADRVAFAEKALGVKGIPVHEPLFDGTAWYGIGLRSTVSPVSCRELILVESGPQKYTTRTAAHPLCGLPFAADPTKKYEGPAPKRSAPELDRVLAEVGALSPLGAQSRTRTLLGAADYAESGEEVWAALGARGKDAPFTCKGLFAGGTKPHIEEIALHRCNVEWPMPGATFSPGPPIKLSDEAAAATDCAGKCSAKEICMLDRRIPSTAVITSYPGGLRATYPDGKAAPVDLVPSCIPVPATCTTLEQSCFLGPSLTASSAGPCPKDTFAGGALLTTPAPHLLCYSLTGRPPMPTPPASSPTTKPSPSTPPPAGSGSILNRTILY